MICGQDELNLGEYDDGIMILDNKLKAGTTLSKIYEIESDWIYEIGTGSWGWGNNELQYYRQDNTSVENGYLIITAKQQNFGGSNYTSSRLKTQGRQFFTYGRIDIRAKLPYGKGIWPALWMLGESFSSVGWPSCGEIDIMEHASTWDNPRNYKQ